jgi:serine phosphatase RsbU (regulator of sigma subunit)/CheY-like chemotaxis protein
VLIIEDDPTMRRALRDNFDFQGYEVSVAEDGEAGLEAARKADADLIILDIMLPGVNGYEICRIVREEGLNTPIIMLTAKSQEDDLLLGLDVGADDYITKPFSIKELLARARAFLRRTESAEMRIAEYRRRLDEFRAETEGQERDIRKAREFQESLMGRPTVRRGLAVAAAHRFCTAMGGDFYDVFDPGEGRTGVLLADVSGHGMNAALVTGMLKVQASASPHAGDPVSLLDGLNESLFHILADTGQFLTIAYAVLDEATGEARYANAGHNPLIVVRADGAVDEFPSTGPPVGMLEDLALEAGSFGVGPGDSVWLYSDGLFEPAGLGMPDSGRGWLRERIVELRRDPLQDWVAAVLQCSCAAAADSDIDDDMAVLAAAIRGPTD